MVIAVAYTSAGQITSLFALSLVEDLALQTLPAGEQLLAIPLDAPLLDAPDHYRITNGVVVPKQQVFLEPNRLTFVADGLQEVAIMVGGLTQACLIQSNQEQRMVTPEDALLLLTSDVPGPFVIQVPAEDPYHWAEPVTVQAVEE